MIGVGGIAGFGNVDLSAWLGLSGVNGVSPTVAAPVADGSIAASLAPVGLSTNLQLLVQLLQQFSLAEILLAILLASNARHCDRRHEHSSSTDGLTAFALTSALIQHGSFNIPMSQTPSVATVSVPSGATLNVTG